MSVKIRAGWDKYKQLMNTIPSYILAVFVIACVGANLMANKSININLPWLALDCGILFSWATFLSMDVIVKRFGAKAATQVSITACIINLFLCLMFFAASKIPGTWGESYVPEADAVTLALNNTFGGTWYVVAGSTIAFVISAVINNCINAQLGKHDNGSFKWYAVRCYVSTMLGQFCDNFIFALLVSYNFFGWTLLQCVMCSVTGAVVELLCEVIFSPVGYKIVRSWEQHNVGATYLDS